MCADATTSSQNMLILCIMVAISTVLILAEHNFLLLIAKCVHL